MRSKRIGNKKSPWITHALIRKMRKRDFLKKKAERTKDQTRWGDFKRARNEANDSIKYAKWKYFSDNLAVSRKDPRKTWQLVKHGAILYNEAEVFSLSITNPSGRPMLPLDWLIHSSQILASCHRILFLCRFSAVGK